MNLNLRGTHYSLGSDKIDKDYQSIAKSDYLPPPSNLKNAKLNDEKKNDLRNHHFLLGTLYNKHLINNLL